jgi:hypothetical protein
MTVKKVERSSYFLAICLSYGANPGITSGATELARNAARFLAVW